MDRWTYVVGASRVSVPAHTRSHGPDGCGLTGSALGFEGGAATGIACHEEASQQLAEVRSDASCNGRNGYCVPFRSASFSNAKSFATFKEHKGPAAAIEYVRDAPRGSNIVRSRDSCRAGCTGSEDPFDLIGGDTRSPCIPSRVRT